MDLLDYILGSSVLLSAIFAVYTWLTQKYIPAKLEAERKKEERAWQTEDRQQQFSQKSQDNALSSTLNISEKSIDHLISLSNGKLSSLEKAIKEYSESGEREAKEFRKDIRAEIAIFRAEIASELSKMRDNQVKISDEVRSLLRQLADVKTQMTVVNRDWIRFDEIVGDIDITLHRIEVAVGIKDD